MLAAIADNISELISTGTFVREPRHEIMDHLESFATGALDHHILFIAFITHYLFFSIYLFIYDMAQEDDSGSTTTTVSNTLAYTNFHLLFALSAVVCFGW